MCIVIPWEVYLAQLGCELLELLPETRAASLTCFVGTSSKDNWRFPPLPRLTNTNVREFGDQLGSSPSTSGVADPPDDGTTQILKLPICAVNAIHFPSGDQSGSDGLEMPLVGMRSICPPFAGTL
jgi:hypothetical protein